MKRTIALAMIFVAIMWLPLFGTIINIPDDYPTIQEGIDASSDDDTVLVQPGTYVENINFNGHNIVFGSLFLTTGDTSYISTTIIDGDSSGSVVTFENGEDSNTVITGFTIQNGRTGIDCMSSSNPIINNNIICDNYAIYIGGGIYCSDSNPIIRNNTITRNLSATYGGGILCESSNLTIINNNIVCNSSHYGGGIHCYNANPIIVDNFISIIGSNGQGAGIYCYYSNGIISGNTICNSYVHCGGGVYCYNSSPLISKNIIVNNSAYNNGGGIYSIFESYPLIINNTISGNSASNDGGGIFCWGVSSPTIINTIIWSNIPSGVFVDEGIPIINYCDIQGGWEGEGNIDIDPLFRNPGNNNFHLMATYCGDPYDSPCIDMGHPDILDILLDCDWGLGELRSDMGAYGGGDSVGVGIDDKFPQIPGRFSLLQNYPNPFNALTTIRYNLPKTTDVTIDIYDILGRKLETLVNKKQMSGYHQIIWDAKDFSSGIYFYKLTAGDFSQSRKMILLK